MSTNTLPIRTHSGHDRKVNTQDCDLTSEVANDLDREYDADESDAGINTDLHHIIQRLDSVQLAMCFAQQEMLITERSPSEVATTPTTLTLDHPTSQCTPAQLQSLILKKQCGTLQHARHIAARARSIQASVVDIKELARYLPAKGTPYDDHCTHMQRSCDFLSSTAQDAERCAAQLDDLPTNTKTMTFATQFEASAQDLHRYARDFERYASGLRARSRIWEEEYSRQLDRRQALWHGFESASESDKRQLTMACEMLIVSFSGSLALHSIIAGA
ncbi:hypothetical protein OPT61_g3803 [Boeremia exigua]|uniref:Uncharacterized protein n=1 Tax=Boeremia exigua TaxID=749465 RepID=A0ACC2IGF4_9PLEO|nr:hypothetical protein OPT61_g3803 [Boeremia exigua]